MNISKVIKLFDEGGLLKLFSVGFLIFGFGKVLQIAFFALMARYLSQDGFGLISLAISITPILAVCIVIAIPDAGMRIISSYKGNKNWGLLKGYLKFAVAWVFLVSAFISLCFLIAHIIFIDKNYKDFTLVVAALLPIFSIGISRVGLMRGFNSLAKALLPLEIFRPLLAMGFIVLLNSDDVVVVGMCYVLSFLISELIGGFWLVRLLPPELSQSKTIYNLKQWFSISLPIQATSLARMALQGADIIFVGFILGLEAAAIYAVAHRLAQAVQVIGRVSSNAVSPLLAQRYHAEDPLTILPLIKKACLINVIITVPAVLFLIVFAPFIVSIFGEEYADAAIILVILSVGQLANTVLNPVSQALNMTDMEKVQLSIITVTAILSLILLPIVTIKFGIIGTAVAISALLCFLNIASYFVGYRVLEKKIKALKNTPNS